MDTTLTRNPSPESDERDGTDVVSLAPNPTAEIATRKRLQHTMLRDRHDIVRTDERAEPEWTRTSIVTRRQAMLRRRRRKQLLVAVALVVGLFPPVWVVYLIAWLIWRSRPPQKSMRTTRKAVRSLEKNQKGFALKQLQEAHLLDPSNNDALYWLGLLLNKQNRLEESEEALSLVSERVPGLPEVEKALVESYIAMNRPENAIHHAQRRFDAAPHSTESLITLADAFEAAGRLDMAVQALEQAPIFKPTLTDGLMRIHYRLGDLYERMGDADRALSHFKRVYARDVSYQDVRSRMASLEATG